MQPPSPGSVPHLFNWFHTSPVLCCLWLVSNFQTLWIDLKLRYLGNSDHIGYFNWLLWSLTDLSFWVKGRRLYQTINFFSKNLFGVCYQCQDEGNLVSVAFFVKSWLAYFFQTHYSSLSQSLLFNLMNSQITIYTSGKPLRIKKWKMYCKC